MRSCAKRILGVLLASSFILPAASCGRKTEGKPSKVREDSPWFDYGITDIEPGIDDSKNISYIERQMLGADDRFIIVWSAGAYLTDPDNSVFEEFDQINIIDRSEDNTVRFIDLANDTPYDHVYNPRYIDGRLILETVTYDADHINASFLEVEIDPETGKKLDEREPRSGEDSLYYRSFKTVTAGSFKVNVFEMGDELDGEDEYVLLDICQDGGGSTKAEIRKDGVSSMYFQALLPAGGSKAVAVIRSYRDNLFFDVDLGSGSVTPHDSKDFEWLDQDALYSAVSDTEGNTYYKRSDGIYRIDMNSRMTEAVFNYSWCGANINTFKELDLISCSDGSVVFCGQKYKDGTVSDYVLAVLKRAPQNPHAGKTILKLNAPDGDVEEALGDAILDFNAKNGKYFIEVTDRYGSVDYYENISDSNDDTAENLLYAYSEKSREYAEDIKSGNGPDMFLNAGALGRLNSSDCFADLLPYVSGLDSGEYYTNIIDACRVDGKVYQFPVTYKIAGIRTDPAYAVSTGTGFTYKEYVDFLNGTLQGKDLNNSGQAFYFAWLFDNSREIFIRDGKVDFSGPEFEAMADYVRDYVQEKSPYYSDSPDPLLKVGAEADMWKTAQYTYCSGARGYLIDSGSMTNAPLILGFPSYDGEGPSLFPDISIAVSAKTRSKEGCAAFIKTLLEESFQTELAMNEHFVINREACRQAAAAAANDLNGDGGRDFAFYDHETGNRSYVFTDNDIRDIESTISSCTRMNNEDMEINIILVEEMQSYFGGWTDLSEAASSARERVQKVIDGRK